MKVFLGSNVKGNSSINQLKSQYSHAPNINFPVIKFVLNDFRGNISRCSAKGFSRVLPLTCPPKITNFRHILMNNDVLGLDISVNDVFVVKIFKSTTNLANDWLDLLFRKGSLFEKLLVKVSGMTKLQNEVYRLCSWKSAVKFDNVWMIKF